MSILFSFFIIITSAYGNENESFDGSVSILNREFLETEDKSIYGMKAQLKWSYKVSKNWGVLIHAHGHYSRFENSEGNSYFFRGNDTGIYYKPHKNLLISAGLLTHQFGYSQMFSPINFVDTASYWSPLTPESIASPSLRFVYKTKKWRVFLSYFPQRFENLYPGTTSSWIPQETPESLKIDNNTLIFPETTEYRIGESIDLNSSLKNNVVAGLRMNLDPVVTQLILYHGVNTDPNAILNLDLTLLDANEDNRILQVDNPITVIPTYQKVNRVGFGLRYTLPFKWRLLYEGNYTQAPAAGEVSSNPLLNTRTTAFESQTHTLGLEWGVPLGKTLLVGVIQGYYSRRKNSTSLGFVSPFREAVLYGLNWGYEGLSLQGGLLDSQSLDVDLVTAEISYTWNKRWSLKANYLLLDGDIQELINGLLEKDSVEVQMQYRF